MTPAEAARTAITAILANLRAQGETNRCVEIRGVDHDDAYQFDPGEPSVVFGTLASPTLRADEGEIVILTPDAAATSVPAVYTLDPDRVPTQDEIRSMVERVANLRHLTISSE